jgi:tripartite-type tricarboxylate transporter receptor subunit TctC
MFGGFVIKHTATMAGALFVLTSALISTASAQYPNRTLQIVVPYTPGGTVDVLARLIAQRLQELWGEPVVILNQPGAGGNIGAAYVAAAAPDGYTVLLSTNSPLTTNLMLYRSLKYDTLRDFEPVIVTSASTLVVVAYPELPVTSVSDLVALAKSKPGQLNAGTSGRGTTAHLSLVQFNKRAGVELTHVPYRGGVPSLQAAVSGEVQVTFSDIVPALPLIQGAKVRALGVTGPQRTAVAPNIPTLNESDMPGFDMRAWVAMVAPKRTPRDIVQKLNSTINKVLREPQVQERLTAMGMDLTGNSPEDFSQFLKIEIERWKGIVADAGIQPE